MMKDKRGVFGIIVFFLMLFTILIVGFMAAMVLGIIDFASDELTPIMKEVGVSSGDANLSDAVNYTFGITDTFVQSLPWVIGLGYVLMLIFAIVFVAIYRENPHPAFMGLFIMLVFLLILGSIIMSNMYQDIYTGTDELATRLQGQTLLSHMILFSPFIMSVIALVAGIIMFAGNDESRGGL